MRGRWLKSRWLSGLAAAAAAGPAVAQTPPPINCPPVVMPNCPPGTGAMPGTPGAPGTPGDPAAGGGAAAPAPGGDAAAAAFAQAPAAGTGGGTSIVPNLMGDLFGARSLRISYDRLLTVRFPNVTPTDGGVLVTPNTGRVSITPLPGAVGSPFNGGPYTRELANVDPYVQQLTGGRPITPEQAQTARAILQATLSGRNLTAAQIAALPPGTRARLPEIQNAINGEITRATNGLAVPALTVGPVTGQLIGGGQGGAIGGVGGDTLEYTALLTGETIVALPGASSVVGRIKLSEDNNPIPLDRVIFNYDYFNNVPFTTDGIGVNRFQFGVEKTFLNGRASLEFRLPFAGTLASTTTQGLETTDVELGNVRFALKYLWRRGETWSFSSGIGVTLPTASDTVVNSQLPDPVTGQTQFLYRLKNNSVQLEPFTALLFTPNDRLFSQTWASVNFDASGGDLTWNRDVFGGSGSARVWDIPVLAVDYQIGYWVVKNDTGLLRGLAPFAELHWNYAIAQDRLIDEVNNELNTQGLRVQGVGNQELNLTFGATAQLGDNLRVTLGGTAPTFPRPDRTFDGQFGLRVNYFFGRTAREMAGPVAPSSY
jgi:hypothetical protein